MKAASAALITMIFCVILAVSVWYVFLRTPACDSGQSCQSPGARPPCDTGQSCQGPCKAHCDSTGQSCQSPTAPQGCDPGKTCCPSPCGSSKPCDIIPISPCSAAASFSGTAIRTWRGSDLIPYSNKGWAFFDAVDPTNGHVIYSSGNPDVNNSDSTFVNSTSDQLHIQLQNVPNLAIYSTRLQTSEFFDNGLFVMDAAQIPFGKYVWPAWWLNGLIYGNDPDAWAANGEIDIIEGGWQVGGGVKAQNTVSIHTNSADAIPDYIQSNLKLNDQTGSCSFNGTSKPGRTCGSKRSYECPFAGCSALWPPANANAYGEAFQKNGGGIYAIYIPCKGSIILWFIPNNHGSSTYNKVQNIMKSRSKLTPDILNSLKNDGVETLILDDRNQADYFKKLQMVINVTLCGDAFDQTGRETCNTDELYSLVQQSEYIKNAKWIINGVSIYQ